MPRAYLRLDTSFDERKESYPDGPYSALVATFCLAEHQPSRGRFRSREYLTRLLGRRGRHVAFLLEHHDLEVLADDRVYVVGWDEWQEGDWKVAERVARIRARRGDTPVLTVPVTVEVTQDVTVARLSVSNGGSGGISGASPLPPTSGGSRSNGTNPRSLAEEARQTERESRRQEAMALHQRYLRGDLTEAVYERMKLDIGKEPDDLTRYENSPHPVAAATTEGSPRG